MHKSHRMVSKSVLFSVLLLFALSRDASGKYRRREYCSVIKSGYRLSMTLYKEFVAEGAKNIIFSPYSISSFTAMLMLGTDGHTKRELRSFLQYGACNPDVREIHKSHRRVREYIEMQSRDVSFVVADRIFPDSKFVMRDNYTRMAEMYYGSTVETLNYKSDTEASRMKINKWIEQKTNGIMKDVLPSNSISSMTEVVLANVIYFKDTWKQQFDPRRNMEADFFVNGNTPVTTTFMNNKGMYKYASNDVFSLIELPYNEDVAYMIILLPKKRDGLVHMENSLADDVLHALNQYGKMQTVVVTIPKFKIEFTKEMTDTYKNLGARSLFGGGDFTPMTDTKGMFISTILHKAFIDVNEEGTEAAAVTIGAMTRSLSLDQTFICNHPFMFYIVHKDTKSILFLGRYVMPA